MGKEGTYAACACKLLATHHLLLLTGPVLQLKCEQLLHFKTSTIVQRLALVQGANISSHRRTANHSQTSWAKEALDHHKKNKIHNKQTTRPDKQQSLPRLSLLAQEHWNTVVDGHKAGACSKVGTASCGRGGAVATGLPASCLTPHSFPHSHYFGNSAGSCVEDLCAVDIVCTGYGLQHTCCLALGLHQDL